MNAAVVVAGGTGQRFGEPGGKQLALVMGRPVVAHALAAFDRAQSVDTVVLVVHPSRVEEYRREAVVGAAVRKVALVVPGGDTRQQSVRAGVKALGPDVDLVAIHDGARPLVTPDTIEAAFAALRSDAGLAGVVVGHPAFDTLKETDTAARVVSTPERSRLWVAQTPQVFRVDVLRRALQDAEAAGVQATDDAALVSRLGEPVEMLEGPRDNIKVTVPEDLAYVEWVLARRTRGEQA